MSGSIYTNVKVDDKVDIYGSYDLINQLSEFYGVAHFFPMTVIENQVHIHQIME